MFFKLNNSKNGIIKSISFSINNLDKDVADYVEETLKGKIKIKENNVIIKCNITLKELEMLNNNYNEFHANFLFDQITEIKNNIKEQTAKIK